jgi:hypothetical protein
MCPWTEDPRQVEFSRRFPSLMPSLIFNKTFILSRRVCVRGAVAGKRSALEAQGASAKWHRMLSARSPKKKKIEFLIARALY